MRRRRWYLVTLAWNVGGNETVRCAKVYRVDDELVLELPTSGQVRRILVKGLHEYVVVSE